MAKVLILLMLLLAFPALIAKRSIANKNPASPTASTRFATFAPQPFSLLGFL